MRKRYYRKLHRYKKKKSFFRKRFFWLGSFALIIFIALFYCLFFLEAFQIEKIIVTGEKKVAKQDIEFLIEQRLENRILFLKTKSIFAVDLGQIKRDILKQFPQIAEVEVSRGFFDAVNVVIIERQKVAYWCLDNGCFLIDSKGIVFEKIIEAEPRSLIEVGNLTLAKEVNLGESLIKETTLALILEIKSKLIAHAEISIVEAVLISEERLNIETTEGWQIYFNLKGDIDWQITELALVLEKQIPPEQRDELEYIDLRFSRVFYK